MQFSSRSRFIIVPYGIASFFVSDPRTSKWLLMGSPGPLLTILATYWYFCISAGPRYMKDRKPYDLKRIIQIYNAVQIVLSVYLVWEVSVLLQASCGIAVISEIPFKCDKIFIWHIRDLLCSNSLHTTNKFIT